MAAGSEITLKRVQTLEQGTAIKAAENQSRKITHDELKAIDQPLLEPANIKAERHRVKQW